MSVASKNVSWIQTCFVAFNSVSAARHETSSFARCGNTDSLRRERGKSLRKLGITHKFLAGDSSVSPEISLEGILGVFQLVCVCVFVSVCVLRSWMGVSLD